MEKTTQEKIAANYKMIMWGTLLTVAHININGFQLIPAFIGHIMIMIGLGKLCNEVGIEYLKDAYKTAKILVVLSVVHWLWRAVFGLITIMLTGCIEILVFVIELSLFGDFLNKTVKLLKENDKVKQADKMRNNRMTFIKFYIGVVIVFALALIPQFQMLGGYPANTLMLSLKIFLSLIMQTVIRCQVSFNPATVVVKNIESEAK